MSIDLIADVEIRFNPVTYTVNEGTPVVFQIELTGLSLFDSIVSFTTVDGSATGKRLCNISIFIT